MEHLADTAI